MSCLRKQRRTALLGMITKNEEVNIFWDKNVRHTSGISEQSLSRWKQGHELVIRGSETWPGTADTSEKSCHTVTGCQAGRNYFKDGGIRRYLLSKEVQLPRQDNIFKQNSTSAADSEWSRILHRFSCLSPSTSAERAVIIHPIGYSNKH